MVETKYGNTLTDKLLKNILKYHYPNYKLYHFLQRGSDERQYNAPGIELPVCAVCRSKFSEFPEYHTSADNLDFISEDGLYGTVEMMKKCITALENNFDYRLNCYCEPQLGKRGLYSTLSQKGRQSDVKFIQDFIEYADGRNDLIDISNLIDVPIEKLLPVVEKLEENNLLRKEEKIYA